jgi:5-methylcytosine-specific restriction endonuclease McrA
MTTIGIATTSRREAMFDDDYDYLHPRYGDLAAIGRKSSGLCHLCLEDAELRYYGPPGTYRADTVTVDHLHPQSEGGTDDPANLRLAHADCNSIRGTRDPDEIRYQLSGTYRAPGPSFTLMDALAVGGVGLAAGDLFSQPDTTGTPRFNWVQILLVQRMTTWNAA